MWDIFQKNTNFLSRMMLIALLIEFLMLSPSYSQLDFRCTKKYCEETWDMDDCNAVPKGCNKTEDGVILSGYYLDSPTECNCCDYCLTNLERGDSCVVGGMDGQPTTTSICGPQLGCQQVEGEDHGTCEPLNTTCTSKQKEYDDAEENGMLGVNAWRPLCDEKGDFKNVQCIPHSICFCIEPHNGERIFGENMYTSEHVPDQMTCKCSQVAWLASRNMDSSVEVAHCLSDGSYDLLQCINRKCTCVDPTDASILRTIFIDEKDIDSETLECFNPEEHTVGEFEKKCERERNIISIEIEQLEKDGITALHVDIPQCSPDGLYEPCQSRDNKFICVDPFGEQIGTYQSTNATDCKSELLLELVEEHRSVILNKKSDAVSWRQKEAEWQKLACKFNALSGEHPRTMLNLRHKFENFKRIARKNASDERSEAFKTGGGVSNVTPPSAGSFDCKMRGLLSMSISGLHSQFDSDNLNPGLYLEEIGIPCSQSLTPKETISQETVEVEYVSSIPTTSDDWQSWSPAMLRQPLTAGLRASPAHIPVTLELGEPITPVDDSRPISPVPEPNVSAVQSTAKDDGSNKHIDKTWSSRRRPQLRKNERSSVSEKFTELAAAKLELVKMKLHHYQVEHVERLSLLKEEHVEKLGMFKAEHIEKLAILKTERKLKELELQNLQANEKYKQI